MKIWEPCIYDMYWYDKEQKSKSLYFFIINELQVYDWKIIYINKHQADWCRKPIQEELKKYFNN